MDKVWWYVVHILAIAGHAGLLLAGCVAFFILALSRVSADSNFVGSPFLAWASGAVGMLGVIVNTTVFRSLQRADKAAGQSVYFKRQTTTILGTFAAMTLVVGDIVFAKTLGRQGLGLFRGLCVITAIAATFTTLSVIADLFKLYMFDREDAEEDRLMGESQRIQL
ncbi:hypothetical protein HD806DRAFT_475841 [Xylariaceae sp. AK1471]|nr:hypothetical protein HD806DRAFT_475841 [Xylariaceae sp. AK1471]